MSFIKKYCFDIALWLTAMALIVFLWCGCSHGVNVEWFHGDTWNDKAREGCQYIAKEEGYDSCWVKGMNADMSADCGCK